MDLIDGFLDYPNISGEQTFRAFYQIALDNIVFV